GAVGWLAGVYAAPSLPPLAWWLGLALVVIAGALGVLSQSWPAARSASVLVAFALLGVLRGQVAQSPPASIADWASTDVPLTVVRVVVEDPEVDAQGARMRVAVEEVRWGTNGLAPVQGDVRATAPAGDWRYGDRLELRGRLSRPLDRDDVPLADVFAR